MSDHRDYAEFYAASFRKLTVQIYLHTGDLSEAQDVVQEAMVRAFARWKIISTYDDPLAWVRKVAWNLATSRWRQFGRNVRFLTRHGPPEPVPGPDPDRVAITQALAKLPPQQRRAVILHYFADRPIAEIAADSQVAEGTVKSWLHRARLALAAHLDDSLVGGGDQ